jgi:hypothetical protein
VFEDHYLLASHPFTRQPRATRGGDLFFKATEISCKQAALIGSWCLGQGLVYGLCNCMILVHHGALVAMYKYARNAIFTTIPSRNVSAKMSTACT